MWKIPQPGSAPERATNSSSQPSLCKEMNELNRKRMGKKTYANVAPLCHLKTKINILFEFLKIDFGLEQYNGFFIEGFRK